ncbi:hypothetical protein BVC80_157g85 [Macleaya cordata]|uniref:Uncharacterized protein n=1 Tax=Macleaya cordata TaxID=56857 RepID=A0A200RC45_MACCD|nr:hypothetical protein BVC80_157g85 [Macleaya cordata]
MGSEENSNHLEPETHFSDPNVFSGGTVDQKSKVCSVGHVNSDKLSDDSDVLSDGGTTFDHPIVDSIDELSEDDDDDDDEVNQILYDEGVKKKLEILAGMVGVDSSKPWIVLDEVVRVLKNLEREKNRIYSLYKN